jgi:hypothetical protein
LDNELILRQFEEIEEKVIKLIDVCKSHEATNAELEKTIERLEQELVIQKKGIWCGQRLMVCWSD